MKPKFVIIIVFLSFLFSCSFGPSARFLTIEESNLLSESQSNLSIDQAIEIANEYFDSKNHYEVLIVGGSFGLENIRNNVVIFSDSSFSFFAYKPGKEISRDQIHIYYEKVPFTAIYPYTEVKEIYFSTYPKVDVNISTYTGYGNIVFIVGILLYEKWDSSNNQIKTLFKLLGALQVLMPNIKITVLDKNSYQTD